MFLHNEYETLSLACISCKLGLYALNLLRRGHVTIVWYISISQRIKSIRRLEYSTQIHSILYEEQIYIYIYIYISHWNLHQRWSRAPQPCKGTAHLETNILGTLGPNPYSLIPYTLLNLVPNKEKYLQMFDIRQQF